MSCLFTLLLIMVVIQSNSARLKQEEWIDPNEMTFLSEADFKLATIMTSDDFQEVQTPYEDPEAQQTYYEGDMMIREDDEKKVAMFSAKRWPNGRIPYIMEDKFSQEERAAIARGIMTLQEETCVKIVPKEDHDADYVWMRRGPGCAAHVGRIGGQQWLFLGQGCFSIETVVHELMHAVGFIHEQSRPDRDEYVKIKWENIKEAAKKNFRKHTTDYLADNGFPYDLMSVMHYREYAFSKNRKPTIVPRKEVPYLRCRGMECPSDQDIKKINYLYKCKDGKSGFLGANDIIGTIGGAAFRKKGYRKPKSKFDNNLLIGEKFYESMPSLPYEPMINSEEDDDYEVSDYDLQSPSGPCIGENCYEVHDSYIDGHMPGETQQIRSVVPVSGQLATSKLDTNNGQGRGYWLSSIFRW